eukprot:3007481-Amphidinium_carterae.2
MTTHTKLKESCLCAVVSASLCKAQRVGFFGAAVKAAKLILAALAASPRSLLSAEQIQSLKEAVNHIELVSFFEAPALANLQEQAMLDLSTAVEDFLQGSGAEALLAEDYELQLETIDEIVVEQLLTLMSVDWGHVIVPFGNSHQAKLQQQLGKASADLRVTFSAHGSYQQKSRIVAKVQAISHPVDSQCSRLAELLPSLDELYDMLRSESESLFQRAANACETDEPDWELILSECATHLEDLGAAFASIEALAQKAAGAKKLLDQKADLKRSALEQEIVAAIQNFDFKNLREFLQRPPESGPARERFQKIVSELQDALNTRYETALACKEDAKGMISMYEAIQRVNQERLVPCLHNMIKASTSWIAVLVPLRVN